VKDWLANFKFKNWATHSSTGQKVTPEERAKRAEEIAIALCNQKKWRTHGRSIKIKDLEKLRLKITDFSKDAPLFDAIHRYYTLLRITFETNIYKVIETATSQVYKFLQPAGGAGPVVPEGSGSIAVLETGCPKCGVRMKIQANIGGTHPLQPGCLPFPADSRLPCPNCGAIIDLTAQRATVEAQTGQPLVT
jgi:hypothetical protein